MRSLSALMKPLSTYPSTSFDLMNAETEARLIEHLHKCVNVHPYKDELLSLMQDQVNDFNSDKYRMLQEDVALITSWT